MMAILFEWWLVLTTADHCGHIPDIRNDESSNQEDRFYCLPHMTGLAKACPNY